jgi:hypothetical protein
VAMLEELDLSFSPIAKFEFCQILEYFSFVIVGFAFGNQISGFRQ